MTDALNAPAGAAPLDVEPLFAPLRVGALELPNRFVLPGMQRGYCTDGTPTAEMADYYAARAAGGVGLIISESTAVDHPSSSRQRFCVRMTPASMAGWRLCAERVRDAGGRLFIQLWHEGAHRAHGGTGPGSDYPTLSPSGLAKRDKGGGRAATIPELHEIRDAYVQSALMAKEIGAAGVEIHAAHGYLLDQFLWRETNIREDEYGGADFRDRMRFPREVVEAVRAAVGPGFPISLRFSQWKEVDFDARIAETPAELELFVSTFRRAGVDMFHASTRQFFRAQWGGSDLGLAGWVKSFTDAPVITVGSVGLDIDLMQTLFGAEAETSLESGLRELLRRFDKGEFDLVAIGRSQIGDADWVSKVRERRWSEIRHFTRRDIVRDIVWDQPLVEEVLGAKAD